MLLDKQNRTDNDLQTESKTITGAINEIVTGIEGIVSIFNRNMTNIFSSLQLLMPIQGTTAEIMQKFNDGDIPEGYYAESWDDSVTEFAIPITSDQFDALTQALLTT